MTIKTVNLTRRILTILFSLLLIGDLFFGLLLLSTGHRVPQDTIQSFWLATVTLVVVIILTHKYVRVKESNEH